MKFQTPSLIETYIEMHQIRKILLRKIEKGIIFWGKTRCAKSTLTQVLNTVSVETFLDQDGQIKYKTKGVSQDLDPIGNKIDSKTVVFNSKGQIIDMPGVVDSRQIGYQIINTYMRGDILKHKIPFKFVILIQQTGLGAPGTDFIDTMKSFLDNFPNFHQQYQKILASTVIVITKTVPKRQIKNLHVKLKNYVQRVPAPLKTKEQEFKKLIMGLIEKDKILKFEQPSVQGQTLNGDNLKSSILSKTQYNDFQGNSIVSYITQQIRKSMVRDNGQSFNEYIQLNKSCVEIVGQGLQLVGEMVRNILQSPNEIITKDLMERIAPFNQANQIYLTDLKSPDFLKRANFVRQNLGFQNIANVNQFKNFQVKKTNGSQTSSSSQGAQVKHYNALAQISKQLTQDSVIKSDPQSTKKLIKSIQLIFFYLSKLINEKDRFQFVRLYYSLITKLNFVYVAIQSLHMSKDQQINEKFSQINVNQKILGFLFDITEKVYDFLRQQIPFHEQICDRTEILLLIKAYYTLSLKVNQSHSIPHLNSTYELLLDIKTRYSYKVRRLTRIRIAQTLYCLANKHLAEKKFKVALSHLVQGIKIVQRIKQEEAIQIGIKLRALFANALQNILKDPKPSPQIKKMIEQTQLKLQDLILIFKANNQIEQQFRIHQQIYQKETEKEIKSKKGMDYFKRLIFHLKDQAALTLINKLYQACVQNIERKKVLNKCIGAFLSNRNERMERYIKYIGTREQYEILPVQLLSRFHEGSKWTQQQEMMEQQLQKQQFNQFNEEDSKFQSAKTNIETPQKDSSEKSQEKIESQPLIQTKQQWTSAC